MVYKFFDKKSNGSGTANEPNYQLANELHKSVIKKFKKRKVFSSFRDNIWGVGLADMQSLSKYKASSIYYVELICVVNMKDKKGTSIVNAFKKILNDSTELYSNRKPNMG